MLVDSLYDWRVLKVDEAFFLGLCRYHGKGRIATSKIVEVDVTVIVWDPSGGWE